MDRNSIYYKQVALLIQTLPYVSEENCFALKGGTAINLFVRNFPRLSVDIDLAYLPLESREDALKNVQKALLRITQRLNNIPGLTATLQDNKPDELRIIVSSKKAQSKESTFLEGGFVFTPYKGAILALLEGKLVIPNLF